MHEKARLGLGPDWEGIEKNRVQPSGKVVMVQTWNDLVFLHAKVPCDLLQDLIPSQLTVESFDETGWLGFVPFWMSKIRPNWFGAVPWLSSFHETNLRTYVTHPEYGPGVWFFSLEASRHIACLIARTKFKLPYFHADLRSECNQEKRTYRGRRRNIQALPKLPIVTSKLENYSVTASKTGPWHQAQPETFEYWLVERYRLYSLAENNRILTSRVFHTPYEIAEAKVDSLRIEGLTSQFGDLDFTSAFFAKSVNVQCFSPAWI